MNPESQDFLSEDQIEDLLLKLPQLQRFWKGANALLLFRAKPKVSDPIFEIQLVWDLGDRIQTYAWIWIDAFSGKILRQFPE